jgi:hypothetical protein
MRLEQDQPQLLLGMITGIIPATIYRLPIVESVQHEQESHLATTRPHIHSRGGAASAAAGADAIFTSVQVAVVATPSLPRARQPHLAGLALQRYKFLGRDTVSLLVLPIAHWHHHGHRSPAPPDHLASSSIFTVIIAHATSSNAFNNVIARLRRMGNESSRRRIGRPSVADSGPPSGWSPFQKLGREMAMLCRGGLLAFPSFQLR